MRQISPYPLWIGHVGDVRDIRRLRESGIEALIDLAINEPPSTFARDMICCRFPIDDGGGNPRWMLCAAIETTAHLLRAERTTVVFCSAGMSRSPSIAATALSLVTGRLPADCLREIASSGPTDVAPALWAACMLAMQEARSPTEDP